MTPARPLQHMTYAEYLAFEEKSQQKHEFIAGEVYAMAGGTLEHSAIAAAIVRELGNALEGKRCRVFNSDARVRVLQTQLSTYPDVSVICDKVETSSDDPHSALNLVVLVEVLSESTEAYDRGAKAQHYRRIASLREYVLVSSSEPLIEVQRLNAQGVWEIHTSSAGQKVELRSLAIALDVDRIYADPLRAGSAQ